MKLEELKESLIALETCAAYLKKCDGFVYSVSVAYTKYGSSCDSSKFSEMRADFVKKAIEKFIKDNQKDIIELSSAMAEEAYKEVIK